MGCFTIQDAQHGTHAVYGDQIKISARDSGELLAQGEYDMYGRAEGSGMPDVFTLAILVSEGLDGTAIRALPKSQLDAARERFFDGFADNIELVEHPVRAVLAFDGFSGTVDNCAEQGGCQAVPDWHYKEQAS